MLGSWTKHKKRTWPKKPSIKRDKKKWKTEKHQTSREEEERETWQTLRAWPFENRTEQTTSITKHSSSHRPWTLSHQQRGHTASKKKNMTNNVALLFYTEKGSRGTNSLEEPSPIPLAVWGWWVTWTQQLQLGTSFHRQPVTPPILTPKQLPPWCACSSGWQTTVKEPHSLVTMFQKEQHTRIPRELFRRQTTSEFL